MSCFERSRFAVMLMASIATTGCGSSDSREGTDAAPSLASSDKCKRYLSCVLVVAPQSYGAVLTLYGDSSECWKTPDQTMNCATACDAAFADISAQCTCEGTTCGPWMPGCADDSAFEPNESYQTAFQTPVNETSGTVTYPDLAICPATDQDFFAVTLTSSGFSLSAIATAQASPPLLAIYSPNGTRIATGTVSGKSASGRVTGLPAGRYYVQVSSMEKQSYALTISVP